MYNTTNPSGNNVIEKARLARLKRENLKVQEKSVIVIQRHARGYLTRKKQFNEWRDDIDKLIGIEKKVQNIHQNENPEPKEKPDDINRENKEWKFASFGSNKLSIYGNFSEENSSAQSVDDDKNEQDKLSREKQNNKDKNTKTLRMDTNKSASDIYSAMVKMLRVFDHSEDKSRFQNFCLFLIKNTSREESLKTSYVSLCVTKTHALKWISQIKQFLNLVTECLFKQKEEKKISSIQLYIQTLACFTEIKSWKSLQKQSKLHRALNTICANFLQDAFKKDSLQVMGKVLASHITSLNSATFNSSVSFLFRQLSAVKFGYEALFQFTVHILTIPSLISQLRIQTPQEFDAFLKKDGAILGIFNDLSIDDVIMTLHKNDVSNAVIGCLSLLANLVEILTNRTDLLKAHTKKCVKLLLKILNYIEANTKDKSKSNTSTWHSVLGHFPQTSNQVSNSLTPLVKKQLEFLWKPDFVRAIFHSLLTLDSLHEQSSTPASAEQIVAKGEPPKQKMTTKISSYLRRMIVGRENFSGNGGVQLPVGGRKLEYEEVTSTCLTSILLTTCLRIFTNQLKMEMLTGLIFMDDVLIRLWRFICELGAKGGLDLFLKAMTYDVDHSRPYFAVFTLFCDMTAHITSMLDDVEFYEQQVPFHLEELLTISAFLKQFMFKACWEGFYMNSEDSYLRLVYDSAHSLLMILYDRDSRKTFTPHNHWLVRSVKASTLRSELNQSTPRAMLLLNKMPFVISHKDRVIYFRSLVADDKNKLGVTPDSTSAYIKIHRSRLVEDGFQQLNKLSSKALKGTIRVKFVNNLGLDEAGIDQDGVFKEFLEETVAKIFNPDMNLFKVTSDGKLHPSPVSFSQDLVLFHFAGCILGKAVYEGILFDLPIANFFLRHLLCSNNQALHSPIDELPSLDEQFYKNLTWMKRYDGDISDLCLTFTYEHDVMGRVVTTELVPGGSSIPVTNDNRFMYIHTLAHFRLHTQIKRQTRAFVAGFRSIVPVKWTSMFSAPEFQRLISGDNIHIDFADLKSHVVYYGGFHGSHRVVRWMWEVVEREFTPKQISNFLKFVTSCSKPPLLGFAHLQPHFSIRCVDVPDDEDTGDTVATVIRGFFRIPSITKSSSSRGSGKDSGGAGKKYRLPTASTCFNLLKLPNYPSKDLLRDKLKQAIANNTGFELS